MRQRILLPVHGLAGLVLAGFILSGCDLAKPRGRAGVAEQAAADAPLRPGLWAIRSETGAANGPIRPVPASQATAPQESQRCVTLAEAVQPGPEFFLGGGGGRACRRDVFTMRGGSVNAVLVCPGQDDISEVPTRLSGSYARESYSVTAEMRVFGFTLAERRTARRIGDC